jgi:hypothetical protein
MQKLHDEGKIYYPKDKQGNYNFNKRPRAESTEGIKAIKLKQVFQMFK